MRQPLELFRRICGEMGVSLVEGALLFVRRTDHIDGCLVGVTSEREWLDIAEACKKHFPASRREDFDQLALEDLDWVNPNVWADILNSSLWNKA